MVATELITTAAKDPAGQSKGMTPTKRKPLKFGKKAKSKAAGDKRGVLYVAHLPDGFEEKEIKGYFKQFGTVDNVKLFRSAKNRKSKGYAFIKFKTDEIAKVAAETMNNYIMFKKALQAQHIPKEKVHAGMFSALQPRFEAYKDPQNKIDSYNRTAENDLTTRKYKAKLKQRMKKLKERGIEWEPEVSKSKNVVLRVSQSDNIRATLIPEGKPDCKLFVGGLAGTTTTERLEKHFSQYGTVDFAKVVHNKQGVSRRFGFVIFNSPVPAAEVLNEKEVTLDGSKLSVKLSAVQAEKRDRTQEGNEGDEPAAKKQKSPAKATPVKPAASPKQKTPAPQKTGATPKQKAKTPKAESVVKLAKKAQKSEKTPSTDIVEAVSKTPAATTHAAKTPAVKTPAAKTPTVKAPSAKTPAVKTPAANKKTPAKAVSSKKVSMAAEQQSSSDADADGEIFFTPPSKLAGGKNKRQYPKTPLPPADQENAEPSPNMKASPKEAPALSTKKSAKKAKTPAPSMEETTPKPSLKKSTLKKKAESPAPTADGSPQLSKPARKSVVSKGRKSEAPSDDTNVTPAKKKTPKISPRVTRSVAKKRVA